MSGFVLGIVVGCFAGALGTLLLLLIIYNIPDVGEFRSRVPERWRGVVVIITLMVASGVVFDFLNLRRIAFATSLLLLLVFVAAHVRGLLVSWITLAIATLTLCSILPPTRTLAIADPQDQVLLVFFVLCGAVGTRLIAHTQKA